MPKLIVYVKASTWQRVVDQAGEDAPSLARALSVEAIEEFVAGLSERDRSGDETATSRVLPSADLAPHVAGDEVPSRSESPSYFPEHEVKSDFVAKKLK